MLANIEPHFELKPSTASKPPHPLDAEWFIAADGNTYGPFTGHRLAEFALEERFGASSDVMRVGAKRWMKAGTDPALRRFLMPSRDQAGNASLRASGSGTVVHVYNQIGGGARGDGSTKAKSPGAALLLSLLIPGGGQFYNGEVGKGFLYLVFAFATYWFLVGFIVQLASMLDAYNEAKRLSESFV